MSLPEVELVSEQVTGKQIYATRLAETGFKFDHLICFNDYEAALFVHSNEK